MVSTASSMLMALTPTPRTFTRLVSLRTSVPPLDRVRIRGGPGRERLPDLSVDPGVGSGQPRLERDGRLPLQDLPEPGVVRVATAHSLRAGDVPLLEADAGDVGDQIGERVDADQPVLPQIERLVELRLHQPE